MFARPRPVGTDYAPDHWSHALVLVFDGGIVAPWSTLHGSFDLCCELLAPYAQSIWDMDPDADVSACVVELSSKRIVAEWPTSQEYQ